MENVTQAHLFSTRTKNEGEEGRRGGGVQGHLARVTGGNREKGKKMAQKTGTGEASTWVCISWNRAEDDPFNARENPKLKA